MATVIPHARFAAARTVRVRASIARHLFSIVRSSHELLFWTQEVERGLLRVHDDLTRLDRSHDEALRLCLRCQEIATLTDPEEMVRQRDAVVRQWVALRGGHGRLTPPPGSP